MEWHAPPSGLNLDNPIWHMAIDLWAHPAFAQACLEAQSDGIRVSHILVALYSALHGYQWSGTEPDPIRHWRTGVTETLRTMRDILPRERADTSGLRNSIKQSELEAERVELAWWWHEFERSGDWVRAPDKAPIELAQANLLNAGLSLNQKTDPQALLAAWLDYADPTS